MTMPTVRTTPARSTARAAGARLRCGTTGRGRSASISGCRGLVNDLRPGSFALKLRLVALEPGELSFEEPHSDLERRTLSVSPCRRHSAPRLSCSSAASSWASAERRCVACGLPRQAGVCFHETDPADGMGESTSPGLSRGGSPSRSHRSCAPRSLRLRCGSRARSIADELRTARFDRLLLGVERWPVRPIVTFDRVRPSAARMDCVYEPFGHLRLLSAVAIGGSRAPGGSRRLPSGRGPP